MTEEACIPGDHFVVKFSVCVLNRNPNCTLVCTHTALDRTTKINTTNIPLHFMIYTICVRSDVQFYTLNVAWQMLMWQFMETKLKKIRTVSI